MDDHGAASDEHDDETHAEIRAGLARVLVSDAFRAAPQLSSFLAFIVERAVEGRSAELKGYTIAVEAFGRAADFDPQVDPIVRVEAGRLRRALAQYYAGEGAGDPVRITIPVGAYVPAFERVDRAAEAIAFRRPQPELPTEPADAAQAAAEGTVERRALHQPALQKRASGRTIARGWQFMAGAGLCVALLALGGWYGGGLTDRPPAPVAAAMQPAAQVGPGAGVARLRGPLEPTILVIALPEPSSDPNIVALGRRFSSLLVDALARFDDLITVKLPQPGAPLPAGADYVLEMSGNMIDGRMESFGRLRSIPDGRIVWSASSTRNVRAEDNDVPEIARRLAARLAEPFGIIHADIRQNPGPGPMPCIYRAIDFRRTMAREEHLAARTCLQALLEADPTFYPAWAQLSFLSLFEYNLDFNPLPEPPLERALSEALTAVRLAPSSARAQQVMMTALFARGATDESLKAGRQAMVRNPYDSDVLATLGARYIQLNRPAEGMPLIERAIEISAGRPPSYDFFALLGAHLLGARQVSRGHGEFLATGTHPYALLGRALSAAHKGKADEKDEALAGLRQHHPHFGADPVIWLSRRGFSPPVIDCILSDLAIARP